MSAGRFYFHVLYCMSCCNASISVYLRRSQQNIKGIHSYIQIYGILSGSQCIEKHTPALMRIVFAATESADTDAYLRNKKCHSHSISALLRVETRMSDFH
ncbi:hypothetical protein C8R48DRAFT_737504, partial [Suillus tomentosus]